MGSFEDWIWVLVGGGLWVFVTELTTPRPWELSTREEPSVGMRLWKFLNLIAEGVLCGMLITFHWRAFHGLLLLVFLVLAALVAVSSSAWRRAKKTSVLLQSKSN